MRDYQKRVEKWVMECFGSRMHQCKKERAQRFLEEALELGQSRDLSKEDALLMVDYVYSRPIGEPAQEVGGVMVTLAALCSSADIDLENSALSELIRVEEPEIMEKIRKKQDSKSAILGITSDDI